MENQSAPDAHVSLDLATKLSLELDPRLADVWLQIFSLDGDLDVAANLSSLVRMAYVKGYDDALKEAERGELFQRLGVAVPNTVDQDPVGPNDKGGK